MSDHPYLRTDTTYVHWKAPGHADLGHPAVKGRMGPVEKGDNAQPIVLALLRDSHPGERPSEILLTNSEESPWAEKKEPGGFTPRERMLVVNALMRTRGKLMGQEQRANYGPELPDFAEVNSLLAKFGEAKAPLPVKHTDHPVTNFSSVEVLDPSDTAKEQVEALKAERDQAQGLLRRLAFSFPFDNPTAVALDEFRLTACASELKHLRHSNEVAGKDA